MTSTSGGGIYLGASSQYPGSISSVDVNLSGTGNVVVATSNGELQVDSLLFEARKSKRAHLAYDGLTLRCQHLQFEATVMVARTGF